MKLLSFRANGKASYGVVSGGGVVDLGARLGKEFPTLRDLIAANALARASDLARSAADAGAQYIVVDTFAKAVQTGDAKGAIADGASLLERIYGR